ncbi:hypothetical protein EAG_11798 [Camponotus floridanus]|uniref:Uncharacterized protein n=1 Tax=Camponotus floridanus TaxID=104421 RepID=E2AUQ0_CAMFO|nr:hypothetical protein EAG_11798 [Camponotus floridanus]
MGLTLGSPVDSPKEYGKENQHDVQILAQNDVRILAAKATVTPLLVFDIDQEIDAPTDNNRITPVFDLSSSSESQELTTGLHEPAAAK